MTAYEVARAAAQAIAATGGRAYYVGGCVRDRLLGVESSDLDIEVYGVPADTLVGILAPFGPIKKEGTAYGVYSLADVAVDFALPRIEKRTGMGHRAFSVTVDPHLSFEEAARRRDFTVNAMLCDVLTGDIIDPFFGRTDMENKVLRAVCGAHFGEDPLRVLRGAQFAARLGYTPDAETVNLCKSMSLSLLPPARVKEELKKALLLSAAPSRFFEFLRVTGHLDEWFSALRKLIGLRQNPKYHPEGDVYTHTMECLDRAAAVRAESSDPYKFMLLALTHDFGKATTTKEIDGVIHAYGHESAGIAPAKETVMKFCRRADVLAYLERMIALHMKPNILAAANASEKATNKMFDEAPSPTDLILFASVDSPRAAVYTPFLRARYAKYLEVMARPYVRGDDLVAAGLAGEQMKTWLAYAHKLRLAGVDKTAALAQTIAFARKNGGKRRV